MTATIPADLQPLRQFPRPRTLRRRDPKIGRNEPCPCGSGRKFKACCWRAGEQKRQQEIAATSTAAENLRDEMDGMALAMATLQREQALQPA